MSSLYGVMGCLVLGSRIRFPASPWRRSDTGPSCGVILSDVRGEACTPAGELKRSLGGLDCGDRDRREASGLPARSWRAAGLFTIGQGEGFWGTPPARL